MPPPDGGFKKFTLALGAVGIVSNLMAKRFLRNCFPRSANHDAFPFQDPIPSRLSRMILSTAHYSMALKLEWAADQH